MNAVKKQEVTPSKNTQLNEADLEAMLHYLRSAHPNPEDLKIKNFKRFLIEARKHEAEDKDTTGKHSGIKWVTALSGSAAAGLATAITAPTTPVLVLFTAALGLLAGWVAVTKTEDDVIASKKDEE
jgi:hypothetical protein